MAFNVLAGQGTSPIFSLLWFWLTIPVSIYYYYIFSALYSFLCTRCFVTHCKGSLINVWPLNTPAGTESWNSSGLKSELSISAVKHLHSDMIHLLSPKIIILWQSCRQGPVISPVGYRHCFGEIQIVFILNQSGYSLVLRFLGLCFHVYFTLVAFCAYFLQLVVGYLEPFPHKHCSHGFF